jgi:hypothetical protein
LDRVDYPGSDLSEEVKATNSAKDCQTLCSMKPYCEFWSWDINDNICYPKHKKAIHNTTARHGIISGPRKCPGIF